MTYDYKEAKFDLLINKTALCRKFFEKNKLFLELGYYYFFNNNFSKAKDYLKTILNNDIRAHWLYFEIELLENKISYYPSYFELRNFFEIDLDILVKQFKGEYVEKLVNYSDFLSTINPEVNKYIGRVFLNNNIVQYAKIYFMKAKEAFYNDPELHFLIAQMYYNDKIFEKTMNALHTCLNILPEYYPAEQLIKQIEGKN